MLHELIHSYPYLFCILKRKIFNVFNSWCFTVFSCKGFNMSRNRIIIWIQSKLYVLLSNWSSLNLSEKSHTEHSNLSIFLCEYGIVFQFMNFLFSDFNCKDPIKYRVFLQPLNKILWFINTCNHNWTIINIGWEDCSFAP